MQNEDKPKKRKHVNVFCPKLCPQRYADVGQLWRALGVPAPRSRHGVWRLTEVRRGGVRGIPSMQNCVIVATDGILCCVVDSAGRGHFGHFAAWVPVEGFGVVVSRSGAVARTGGARARAAKESSVMDFI